MQTLVKMTCVLALLAAVAGAQTTETAVTVDGPITHMGTYHMGTNTVIPAPPPTMPEIVFDNSVFTGSAYTPPVGQPSFDSGTLSAALHNDITTVNIGYFTNLFDPPGPGGESLDIVLSLHAGGVVAGVATPGVTTSFLLSGVPISSNGAPQALSLAVAIPATNLPDGPIAWSTAYFPSNPADAYGPLLVGPPNEAGVIDALNHYSDVTFTTLTAFFNFGASPPNPIASTFIQMVGEEPAECFLVIGSGPGDAPFEGTTGIHLFETLVGPSILDAHEVLMEDIPSFVLPGRNATRRPTHGAAGGGATGTASASGTTFGLGGKQGKGGTTGSTGLDGPQAPPSWMIENGGTFSVQVLMWNPWVFPGQPEQVSYGLQVHVGLDGRVTTEPFGTGTGIEIWHEISTNDAGQRVIRFPFLIPGL